MDPDHEVRVPGLDRMADEAEDLIPAETVRLLEGIRDQQRDDARRQCWTLLLVALGVLIAAATLVATLVR